ncbi:MAG: hypothetical protein LQ350_008010 [Teloschistes chrysophthalmus]|nr:MAG: hypothetical protein LQ350_008010 [Niorma chrysophthalma]
MLYTATRHDRVNIAKYCLDHSARVDAEIMMILLINRAEAVYELFLDTHAVDVNYFIPHFGDILSDLAMANDFDWVRLCLSHGADSNRNIVDEYKPVLAAVAESEHGSVEMLRLLIDNGAVVKGSGALLMAAEEGKMGMVRFLIERGADVDEMGIHHPMDPRFDEDVGTPLHKAAYNGHVHIVRFLTEMGADVELRDGMGRTAIDLAKDRGHDDVVKILAANGG